MGPKNMQPVVPVSIGELIDKYSILEIKRDKIKNVDKRKHILNEISHLEPFIDSYDVLTKEKTQMMFKELLQINTQLWEIEDNIRIKESKHEFDDEFIQLSRNVYKTNDLRYEKKMEINKYFKSGLIEVKEYSSKKINTIEGCILKGKSFLKSDKLQLCAQSFDKAVELSKDKMSTYQTISDAFSQMDKIEFAIQYFDDCIRKKKNKDVAIYLYLLNEVGMLYCKQKQFSDAIYHFEQINKYTFISEVNINMAICLTELKEYNKAIAIYSKLSMQSNNSQELKDKFMESIGSIHFYQKNYDLSIQYYNKSKNKSSDKIYNTCFPYLASRQIEKGYQLYEHRLKNNNICPQTGQRQRVDIPCIQMWQDIEMPCQHLLVLYEQGIGDNIQYFKYLIELSRRLPEMKITYFCREYVSNLFNTKDYSNINIVQQLSNNENYEYKLYIMSLPYILKIETIESNKINYIRSNTSLVETWKNKFATMKRVKIAFTFNGLLTSFIDKQLTINNIAPILDLDADFICVHKKNDIKNIEIVPSNFHIFDIDQENPFEDTIAILQNVDLFITIDTGVTHLAGVMGIKTWLLLGYGSDWRWFKDETKCDLYDSVEYIRLKENIPFKGIVPKVVDKLKSSLLSLY